MGRKLDALLGRNFRASKFIPLLNLALSRLSILSNQRQLRRSQAQSDLLQLLQLHHHPRALLRVEQVIKDQNVLDAYVMIEGYLNLLIESATALLESRDCPEDLKEAVSSLLFAASRCGDFPELQQIKSLFTTRFGKEFTARAVELRNNCGVNHLLMQKLSTRQPSLESRMDFLKSIASENGIALQLDPPLTSNEEKLDRNAGQNKPEPRIGVVENLVISTQVPSGSKQKYKDVADAAQAAFESAAQAAAAARAAMELSRSESQDPDGPTNSGSGTTQDGKKELDIPKLESILKPEIKYRNGREEDEEEASKITAGVKHSKPASSSSSSSRELSEEENGEMEEGQRASHHQIGLAMESKVENTEVTQKPSFRLNLEKKPISVRTRRVRGY